MVIRKLSLLLVGGALRCWARRIGAFGPGRNKWVPGTAPVLTEPLVPWTARRTSTWRSRPRRSQATSRGPPWHSAPVASAGGAGRARRQEGSGQDEAQPKGQTKTKGQAKAKATARGKGDQEGKKGQQPAAPAGAASLHRKQVRAVRAHRACGENGDPQLCHQRLEHGHLSA